MRRQLPLIIIAVSILLGMVCPVTLLAQTPEATPVPSKTAWQVTGVRNIEVAGEPIALSPDGQWLAGVGEDDQEVCAWDAETLEPICADVGSTVEPYMAFMNLQWAPDSSAFAFASGSMRRLEYGDVFVFDIERGGLTNLTNIATSGDGRVPLYVGTDWTSDSQYVIFGLNYGFDAESPRPEIGRADRAGTAVERIPLPSDWPTDYNLRTPPFVANDGSVFVAIHSNEDIEGIWKLTLDGSAPEQLVPANDDSGVAAPMIVSASADARYLNIVSMRGLAMAETTNTYFLLDTETGNLMPLDDEGGLQFVSFGPSGNVGMMVQDADDENILHTIDLTTGEVTPVEYSPDVGPWLTHIPVWAENDTVFLPDDDGGTLVTLKPVGSED